MRKRITYWVVAAVVTAAVVAAGVLAANRGGARAPARLPVLTAAAQSTAAAGSGQATQGMAPQSAPPAVPGIVSRALPPYTIQVRGPLPSLPTSAYAFVLTPGSSAAQAGQVAALASTLGLHGKPLATAGGWTVSDGTRRLVVGRLAGLPWSFSAQPTAVCGAPGPLPPTGTYNGPMCPAGSGSASSGGVSSRVLCGGPAPKCPVPEPGQVARAVSLPSLQSAEQTAYGLLSRLGVQPDTAGVQALRLPDRWQVSVPALVGGLPTSGFTWTVGVGTQNRVVSATGFLVSPTQGDRYPLITVQQALDRLRNQRARGPIIMPAEPLPCPTTETPCSDGEGKPRLVRTVTGVRLGLVFTSTVPKTSSAATATPIPTGYLVPAFLFRLEGGWSDEIPVVAVQDRYLTQPPATAQPLRSSAGG